MSVGHHSLHPEVARFYFHHAPVGMMPDDTLDVLARQIRLDFIEGSRRVIQHFAAVRDECVRWPSFRVALDFRPDEVVCASLDVSAPVLKAVTVPSPLIKTSISFCATIAVTTGTARAGADFAAVVELPPNAVEARADSASRKVQPTANATPASRNIE